MDYRQQGPRYLQHQTNKYSNNRHFKGKNNGINVTDVRARCPEGMCFHILSLPENIYSINLKTLFKWSLTYLFYKQNGDAKSVKRSLNEKELKNRVYDLLKDTQFNLFPIR